MLEFMSYITQDNVIAFSLLFLRFSGILAFFPFFDNQLIPPSIRASIAFLLAIVFMALPKEVVQIDSISIFLLACVLEITLGFIAGLALQIIFSAIVFATDIIGFSMGLTMASAYDPMTGGTKPIIGQVIILLSVLAALHFNFHHVILEIIAKTLQSTPLGGFLVTTDMINYFVRAFSNLFTIGFSMAFPVVAIVLLSDIIFGMIMKTHPQFNLLVIGFPIKIAISLAVLVVIVPSIIITFRHHLSEVFKIIWKFLA